MKRIAGLAVMIFAVVTTGCSTSTSTSSSTTTTSRASTATSSTVANSLTGTLKWVADNNSAVTMLSADVATLGSTLPAAVSSRSPASVSGGCQKLATDTAKAKTLPPIPNSTAQKAWTTLLNQLNKALQKCSEGIAKDDTAALDQAAAGISGSSSTLKTLSDTLGL